MKFVIDRAKQAQVPKHIIDKAIDKAKGNTDETFTEGRYEGFGPNGSMLIVDTLTSTLTVQQPMSVQPLVKKRRKHGRFRFCFLPF